MKNSYIGNFKQQVLIYDESDDLNRISVHNQVHDMQT